MLTNKGNESYDDSTGTIDVIEAKTIQERNNLIIEKLHKSAMRSREFEKERTRLNKLKAKNNIIEEPEEQGKPIEDSMMEAMFEYTIDNKGKDTKKDSPIKLFFKESLANVLYVFCSLILNILFLIRSVSWYLKRKHPDVVIDSAEQSILKSAIFHFWNLVFPSIVSYLLVVYAFDSIFGTHPVKFLF